MTARARIRERHVAAFLNAAEPSFAERIEEGKQAFDNQHVQPGMERMHKTLRDDFARAFADISKPRAAAVNIKIGEK
jgi:hypothetical protein